MDEKNLLVTGGAGFIGSRFIDALLKRELFHGNIINYDALTPSSDTDIIESFNKDSRYTFIEGNICDKQKVRSVISAYDIDLIVNIAGETEQGEKHPNKQYIKTNVYGVFRLLEAARRKKGIHFHHISSDKVFGHCEKDTCFSETSAYDPKTPFAASKAAADHLVRSYGTTYGMKTSLSYCSNLFGPGQGREKFIPKMITSLLDKMPFPIYGDGNHTRDWLFIEDFIEALFLILSDEKASNSYAVSGKNRMRNIDLAKQVVELYCQKEQLDVEEHLSLITFIKDRPHHELFSGLDGTKLQKELGFSPKRTFQQALDQTIDWYKESYEAAFSTF